MMGSLSSMMTGMDADTAFLETRLKTVDLFAKDTSLPKRSVKEISAEIRSITEGIIITESQRVELIKSLTRELRTEVVQEMYEGAVGDLEVLKGVNSSCLAMIMTKVEKRDYGARIKLYEEGDAADHVYFLLKGRIRLLISARNLVFKTIVAGSFFGESEVIENRLREFTAETETFCDMLIIAKDVFLDVLQMFPDIKAKITEVRESRKVKDKERMSQLVDLIEVVEIRKEVTYCELAGSKIIRTGNRIKSTELTDTPGRLHTCLVENRELVEVSSR
jgi:CRP-like cAMP-binding protein